VTDLPVKPYQVQEIREHWAKVLADYNDLPEDTPDMTHFLNIMVPNLLTTIDTLYENRADYLISETIRRLAATIGAQVMEKGGDMKMEELIKVASCLGLKISVEFPDGEDPLSPAQGHDHLSPSEKDS